MRHLSLAMLLAAPFCMGATPMQDAHPTTRIVRVRNAPDSSGYHVHVLVNGQRVRMLVDTGSNVTILSEADARRVGARKGEPQEVDAYGGAATMYATRLASIVVAGAELGPATDAAIDDSDNAESILGMDLLDRDGISLHVEGGVMTIAVS